MFKLFEKKYDTVVVLYKVKQENTAVILESCSPYNGGFYCFHCALECYDEDLAFRTYVKLNENILREIKLKIRHRYVEKFDYDLIGLLDDDVIERIRIVNKKLLNESTI